jgi:hypothetical protein
MQLGRHPRSIAAVLSVGAVLTSHATDAEAAFTLGEEPTYLKIGGLVQVQASSTEDAAPNREAWDTEFYLRRTRLLFFGQLNPLVNYFIDTDIPNFGRNGDTSGRMVIQDAFVELNFSDAVQLDLGMLLVPFSHHGSQGATSLFTLDYHPDVMAYPVGSNYGWRDFGLMVRGMPAGPWFEYRLAVLNGVRGQPRVTDETTGARTGDGRNPGDYPRLTARLVGNLFDPEGGPGTGGFYPDAVYLEKNENGIVSPKKVLSFGLSADYQPGLVVNQRASEPISTIVSRDAYYAVAGDVNWDIPLVPARTMATTGQVNVYYWYHGDRDPATGLVPPAGAREPQVTGMAVAAEAGFRYQEYAPVLIFDAYRPTMNAADDHTGELTRMALGFGYFPYAHAFNVKAQFGVEKKGSGSSEGEYKGSVLAQAQLFF